MYRLPVGLQLYTVRDEVATDFAQALRRVADIGYRVVELAGFHGKTAPEVKSLLDDNELSVAGSHVGLDRLESDLDAVITENHTVGNHYVVCPSLPQKRREDLAGYRGIAASFNKIGAALKSADLQLAYHNHAFEFDKLGGEVYAYDVLMGETDPSLVQIEMDTFWVQKGGEEPAAYLRKYAGRVPLIHLKDMTPAPEETFAEVGEGTMDIAALFQAAEIAGGKYYIVEQDKCQRPAMESALISYNNLAKMGII